MPWELIWTKKGKASLKALEKAIAQRVFLKLEELASRESVFLEQVKGKSFFKYRVGSYRVLLNKFPATKKLAVLFINHRKKVYKRYK